MKKILFLFLTTIVGYGQTYQNPTFGTITTKTTPTVSTVNFLTTIDAVSGQQGKVTPINVTIPTVPLNYTPSSATLGGHLSGIDTKLGQIVTTTAGVTTRVWFTADATTITAGAFYLTNATSKGTAASAIQNVVNDDNQKKYYTQDLIGQPFATATIFPIGIYAGNLSASTTPNSAQQRWTVELYKCNNAGTPIASGITGAPVGDLGVTVITILDSGLLTLADGSVTNVSVSGNLASPLSIAVGERIRYHVSAEKVGTNAANITQSVYYGTSYNSFLDVPVPLNTNAVQNLSTVTGSTTTDALNFLKNHNNLDNVQQAGAGVTNGHVSDGVQILGGTKSFSSQVKFKDGTMTNPSISFYGTEIADDTGFNHSSDGNFDAVVNGVVKQKFGITNTESFVEFKSTAFVKTGATPFNILLAGGTDIPQNSFIQNQNTSAQTANMWVTGSGYFGDKMGIGTNNPVEKLVVSNNNAEGIEFTPSIVSGSNRILSYDRILNAYVNLRIDGDVLDVYSGGAFRTRFNSNGNLLIGTVTDTGNRLRVFGGSVRIDDLAGLGTRTVVADASGNLSATLSPAISGTYTPTFSNVGNTSSITFGNLATYQQIGNIVTVTISVNVTPTTSSTLTQFTATLPVNRATTSTYSIGTGTSSSSSPIAQFPIHITSSSTTTVNAMYIPTNTSVSSCVLQFQYDITK